VYLVTQQMRKINIIVATDGGAASWKGWSCASYLQGWTDVASVFNVYCAPDGVTNGQIFKVVFKYLNNNPEKLHETKSVLVAQALKKAFPCDEKT
jgi:hypothetical protein